MRVRREVCGRKLNYYKYVKDVVRMGEFREWNSDVVRGKVW